MANAATAGTEQPESGSHSYECHICLDAAKEPVVSLCGHLFCWSCLHRWMETQNQEWGQAACPVCKAVIDRERVVPLYGRGGANRDPRTADSPPRPRPQRTEFPEHQDIPFFGENLFGHNVGGFHFSFGIGTFPFGVLYSNLSGSRPAEQGARQADNRNMEDVLANIFLYLGIILMFGVIFTE